MKLYVYDHCPYCVKARMIFGLKNIDFELVCVLNDDYDTPMSMIGQKMLPILETAKDKYMAESLDIINYIDNLDKKPIVKKTTNKKLSTWLSSNSTVCYELAMPRWVKANPPLEEFKTQDAIDYFTKKKESYIGPFKEKLNESASLIEETEEELHILESLFEQKSKFINKTLSIDDFHLFAFLRSLSIVKGLNFPGNVKYYMENMSKQSGVPLHTDIAL